VILDSAGRANIWLVTTDLYYWELEDSAGNQLWTADNIGQLSGTADVSGPASSTDNAVVRFDGVTGKIIQNSSVTISDGGAISATSLALTTALPLSSGGTGSTTASGARTNLGLGDLATKGDGDYGDITVSASGATWTIDANAVTRTKIVNNAINGEKLSGFQSGDAPVYGVRAFVCFDGTGAGGSRTVRSAGNVVSVTDNGTGNYTVNFDVAMPDANYATAGMAGGAGGTSTSNDIVVAIPSSGSPIYTVSAVQILTVNAGSGNTDRPYVSVWVIR